MIAIDPDPTHYPEQLAEKERRISALMTPFQPPSLEVFQSPALHYRLRAEFTIWHQDERSHYAVFSQGRGHAPEFVEQFPVAAKAINQMMPRLLTCIHDNPVLRHKLFQLEFLSTLTEDLLVTLVYHKPLNDDWTDAAKKLEEDLGIGVLGRSRKQKVVLSRDFVTESMRVGDQEFRYRQLEGCFSQPNGKVCEQMLKWVSTVVQGSSGSLLELYCGNGNFTLPLSRHFDRVLATEISKPLIRAAEHNCEVNKIDNIAFGRMSAEEVSEAIAGLRPFRRLQHVDLADYDFSTVFVDPPRAGLDDKTLDMVQGFDNILYVSCNPNTLSDNLQTLSKTHEMKRLALFDQFPYTDHMECGVYLQRK